MGKELEKKKEVKKFILSIRKLLDEGDKKNIQSILSVFDSYTSEALQLKLEEIEAANYDYDLCVDLIKRMNRKNLLKVIFLMSASMMRLLPKELE